MTTKKLPAVFGLAAALLVSLGIFRSPEVSAVDKKYNPLTSEEEKVIIDKGTEKPFSGKYNKFNEAGIYACKRCGAELYRSSDKFDSACGWPSFDDEIAGAITRVPDQDGVRTEIICSNCGSHLGHVFAGEKLTDKNIRHCVNSISLNFIKTKKNVRKAYFAGGCFWGVEYYFQNLDGVASTKVGYMGGHENNPTYAEVSDKKTGHAETLGVTYDASKVSYETLAKLFFEIHDPTQKNRQGPDIGEQYRSAVFYADNEQKDTAEKLINILREKGYDVVTEVAKAGTFWPAEDYHQRYYEKNKKQPYCHVRKKRF
ncbi:MAG: bifunctional methionine sulfoxide reductase B/A protein [Endomicrobiia bacterium]|nr:bifunctional methionine sulfoxide reductase B/A protein [Endomicrobiia bacterium]